MSAGVTIHLQGSDELIRRFAGMPESALTKLDTLMDVMGLVIQADAQMLVPVRTGDLKRSIRYQVIRMGDVVTLAVGPNADHPTNEIGYSAYVEYGTSRQAAQPYLWPAVEMNRQKLFDEATKLLLSL